MARAEAAGASARSDSIKGLAQSIAKPAYRRLLTAEPALRRAVPALIVAFFFLLEMNEPRQYVEEAIPLQHLLPQITRTVSLTRGVRRVSRTTLVPPIERQEVGCRSRQTCCHRHRLGVHSEAELT